MTEKEYWFWLCTVEGIGAVRAGRLLEHFQCPGHIYEAAAGELKKVEGIGEKECTSIINSRNTEKVIERYAKLKEKNIYFVTKADKEYPERLKHIPAPPQALYVKGGLPSEEKISIAVVGARNCSEYGRVTAVRFARELSDAGIQVISGLARGIDGYAHRGAMLGRGSTYGVLGCGIDICYPEENINLYMEMQEKGGIISEYAPGIPGKPGFFPMRNRIISGLSDGILVVEAKERSGALITADLALEQGKAVFAIPGRIGDGLSRGCNNLIRAGAELVECTADLLANYCITMICNRLPAKKYNNLLETKEKIVYASLSYVPKHMNQILGETELLMTEVIEILFSLERRGYIKETAKNYYVVTGVCVTG